MIRAIVFDCFGVLTTDGWLPFKRQYFSHNPELLKLATDLNRQVDAGYISYEDFMQQITELAQVTLDEAERAIQNNVANEPLFELIRSLKPQYKMGFLSNAGANWVNELFNAEQVKLFDVFSISSETGYVKPEVGAYQDIATKLQLKPQECLLVDDQPRYCQAAIDYGMPAIVYENFEQFQKELKTALTGADGLQ